MRKFLDKNFAHFNPLILISHPFDPLFSEKEKNQKGPKSAKLKSAKMSSLKVLSDYLDSD